MNAAARLEARVCVVGGGPAGIMLAFLLARAGCSVIVLEKHEDFLRDFRGDTVHPSTMTVLDELGLLDDFLKRPHSEIVEISGHVGKDTITIGDFSHVPAKTKFLGIMPQWDFLNFLTEKARALSGVSLAHAHGGHRSDPRKRPHHRRARDRSRRPARDSRRRRCRVRRPSSTLRDASALAPRDLGAPMDILWMRLSKRTSDQNAALGFIGAGRCSCLSTATTTGNAAMSLQKAAPKRCAHAASRRFAPRSRAPRPSSPIASMKITSWDQVKLLSVAVNRLDRWYLTGLLFIGDAAHAMSPIGGVGINLAIQDAVAAANILSAALARSGPIVDDVLAAVQKRRTFPTVMTQGVQLLIQRGIIANVLRSKAPPKHAPALLRWLSSIRVLRRIPAYIVGIGFRPEHVNTVDCAR